MNLQLVELSPHPVVGKSHAIEDHGVAFGFEGGTAHKVGDSYYIFTTENLGEPKTALSRLALWTSQDGLEFRRHSTVRDFSGDWREPETYSNPWSPMVVFDTERNRWSLFYVHYRRKPGSVQPYNMTGRMARLDSATPGRSGITGPWEDGGFVDLPDDPDPWEGSCKVVSFFPYRVDDRWLAFYGSNSAREFIDPDTLPQEKNVERILFCVGLAESDQLTGRYERRTELNPVLMDPEFVENPVVCDLPDGSKLCLYDGGNDHGISHALSRDGLHWEKERVLELPDAPSWLKAVRTPLGLIAEEDGTYTIFFTAFDGENPDRVEPLWHDGFGQLGRVSVRLG